MSLAHTRDMLNIGRPYNAAWRMVNGPDRDNWNTIETACREDRTWLANAALVVAGKKDGVKMSSVWRARQLESTCTKATAAAEQYLVKDRAQKSNFAENRKWREADDLFHTMEIKVCQGKSVTVRQDLTDSRYYCKHKGGTPIFNYEPHRRRITGQSYATIMMTADGVVEHPSPPPVWDPNVPADRSEFTYNGQVPRAAKEYIARLDTLLPHIVRTLVCVVLWEGSAYELLEVDFTSLHRPCPIKGIIKLVELWKIIFGEGRRAPVRIYEQMERNRVLTETAYLLNELEGTGGSNDLKANLKMLRHSLTYMMGIDIKDAARLERRFMKKEAFDELFDPKSTKVSFIWANSRSLSRIQNIHQYYQHRFYTPDPLGILCYQFSDTVWEKIQGAIYDFSQLPPESIARNNLVARLTRAPHYPAHLQRSHLSPEYLVDVLSAREDRAPQSSSILCSLDACS
ncbi:unnamed protein product [Clonostachys rosea]|uniref:Uncharacterized protein n=1 Tax=Bionectria ochroleuca TaxID=29856 RepID=A0ABY6U5G4_BIOOC|nr:unnamed protein product [Clonostachys rosea]